MVKLPRALTGKLLRPSTNVPARSRLTGLARSLGSARNRRQRKLFIHHAVSAANHCAPGTSRRPGKPNLGGEIVGIGVNIAKEFEIVANAGRKHQVWRSSSTDFAHKSRRLREDWLKLALPKLPSKNDTLIWLRRKSPPA